MPSLQDLSALTGRLDELTAELHSELTQGAIDFRKMVRLADDIGHSSDRLAQAFNTMANALETSLDGSEGARDGSEEDDSQSTSRAE